MLRGSSLESNSILNAVLIVHSHSFFLSLKTIPTSLLFRYKIFSLSTYLSMFNNFFQIPKKEFNISFSIMEPYSEGMLKAKVRGDAANWLQSHCECFTACMCSISWALAETENGWGGSEARGLRVLPLSNLLINTRFGIYPRNKKIFAFLFPDRFFLYLHWCSRDRAIKVYNKYKVFVVTLVFVHFSLILQKVESLLDQNTRRCIKIESFDSRARMEEISITVQQILTYL